MRANPSQYRFIECLCLSRYHYLGEFTEQPCCDDAYDYSSNKEEPESTDDRMCALNRGAKKCCNWTRECDCGATHGSTGLQDEGRILALVTPAVFALSSLALPPFTHARTQCTAGNDCKQHSYNEVHDLHDFVKRRHCALEHVDQRRSNEACDPWPDQRGECAAVKESLHYE